MLTDLNWTAKLKLTNYTLREVFITDFALYTSTLAYCIVAGRNLAAFMATPRDDDGVPLSAHKHVALADLVEARKIVDDAIVQMAYYLEPRH